MKNENVSQAVGPSHDLRHPCVNLLLRIACFDAYALAAEFVDDAGFVARVAQIDPSRGYHAHPRYRGLRPGMYSDDTERAVANARVLVGLADGIPATPLAFANTYVDEFNRSGKRKGYARNYQAFLEKVKSGEAFLETIKPASCRNGAAMGAGPIGVLPSVGDVLRVAAIQASVTHNTKCGIFSARAAALATHFALYEDDPLDPCLRTYLLDHFSALAAPFGDEDDCGHGHLFAGVIRGPWRMSSRVWDEPDHPTALGTIAAALALVAPSRSDWAYRLLGHAHHSRGTFLLHALRHVLVPGSDTDSVAAVLAAWLAPRFRHERLPTFFERDLEFADPWTGTPRLLELGGLLMKKYL